MCPHLGNTPSCQSLGGADLVQASEAASCCAVLATCSLRQSLFAGIISAMLAVLVCSHHAAVQPEWTLTCEGRTSLLICST